MNVSLRTTACITANTTTSNNNNTSALKAVPSLLRWFFVFMMLGATSVNAQQLSNYGFSFSNTASLTDMSSGTTQILAAASYQDDVATAVTNIGFSFSFNGTTYTQFSANSNGQLQLGASAIGGTARTPLASTAIFAPIGGDNGINTGGQIHYKVTGTAGSQLLIVEWVNLRIPHISGGGGTGSTIQLRLYEGTNVVQYVYGLVHNNQASSLNRTIFYSSNTDASNVGYITIGATPTVTYQSTAINNAFAASSAVSNLSSTTDGSRWMYTFTPPGPCATPAAQPTGLSLTPSGLSVLNGSFTAASPAPTGYLVVRTTTNVAPSPVNGTSYSVGSGALGYVESFGTGTSWTSTGLLSSTTYYYWVFSYNNTGCSGGPLYLTTAPLSGNQTTGACSVSGTKTVGAGGDYLNITQAVAALVNNGVSGHVILELTAGYPGAGETFPINLGAVPCMDVNNTVTIRLAAGAGAKTITAADSIAIFQINGGQYWRIDGRQGGTGSTRDLTISNTRTTASTAGASAIRFINEASNNIIRYTNLRSSLNSTTSGTVFFSTTTGANGNDNNTIDNNSIDGGAGAAAAPTTGVAQNGVYSLGTTTTAAQNNSGNTVSNNIIFNQFLNGSTNAGVLLKGGNTDWTITGNHFYQSSSRTPTTATTYYGIFVDNGSGNNFVITNNFIGGSAANNGGSALTVSGTLVNRMTAIGLVVGTATPSSVQGNTISNINFSTGHTTQTIATSTALGGSWSGIIVGDGSVNIGTTTGNVIGSQSTTGNITVSKTASTTQAAVIGIGADGEDLVNIHNNTIGGITATSGGATFPHAIVGILSASSGGGITTINNNTVGSATTANSLQITNVYTGTTSQYINGISNTSNDTVSITNNLLANYAVNSASASITGSAIRAISAGSGAATITGNTIRDMSSVVNATSATTHGVIGIYTGSGTVGTWSISDNTIYNLSNSHASGATYITGIYQDGPALGGTVANNNIYNLSANATNASAIITGIYTVFGTTPYYNNRIRLGVVAGNATIYGFYHNSGSSNIPSLYHNTVYIGGSSTAGASTSYALQSIQTTNPVVLQNNIFINARSNGGTATGKHYAIGVPGAANLTINYNIYRATGTGGVFGVFNNVDQANLAAWQASTTQDANSKDQDPCLANPTAATPDMHLTNCSTLGSPADGGGTPIALVTTDMDGQARAGLSPVDIGADAGDYGPSGVDVGVIALVRPTATSCHSTTEDVIVTLKNFSTSVHDFTVNPVTITVNVTGQLTAGPLTTTINTGTLAAGTNMNVTVGTVDMVTNGNGTYTFTSTASAAGDVTPGNDGNVTNVELNYTALSVAATATSSNICISGATNLTATVTGGTAPFTYLWDAGTDLDSNVNNTGTINTTTSYNVTVTDACGISANSSVTVTVLNPTVASTTPGTRCGEGTVQLSATISGGTTLTWYDVPSGGTPLATGTTFTTPVINATTPYYVSASDGGTTFYASETAPESGSTGTNLTSYGQHFTVTTGFTLASVDVYSSGGTALTISLYNEDGTTQLQTTGNVNVTANVMTTIPVGFYIAPGTYRLIAHDMTGNFIRDNTGVTYPFNLGTVGTMNGFVSSFTATISTSASYYFMYNWLISTGCESARTAVTATVTTPPAITATVSDADICYGSSTTLSVTSPNDPGYTYTWYEDSLTGPSHVVTPLETVTYLVSAVDSSGGPNDGCATSQQVTVTVSPMPEPVTINPSPAVACPGGVTLVATSGQSVSDTIGKPWNGTTQFNTTGSPYRSGAGASWFIKSQYLITASELTALGFSAGNITSLGFQLSQVTSTTTLHNFSIRMGHTSATALTSTFETTPSLVVFSAPTLTTELRTLGPVHHVFTTPFPWDGVSNVVIQICQQNNTSTTTTGVAAMPITPTAFAGTSYAASSTLDCVTTTSASTSTTRPIMYISANSASPITWSPADGLNTTVGDTVIANPTIETTYTATATLGECTTSNTVTVSLSTLAISASGTDIACFGDNTGTISASGSGGTAPYTYSVDGTNYQASGNFTGLIAGTYTVYVKDANAPNNCVATTTVTINQPAAAVSVTATGVDPVCNGASDGSVINVVGAGGTGGYTYTITGGSFTGLAAGTYTVTATDANGCTGTVDVTLTNPAPPAVSATNNSPVCAGTDVVLTATPGYAAYSWTGPGTINNATTDIATAVAPNNGDIFTVTITDINGCTNSASTTVTVNPNLPVSVAVAVQPATEVCSGTMVTFTATPTNGGSNPTYQWYVNNVALVDSTNPTLMVNNLNDQDVVTVVVTSDETCTSGNPATSDPITITITGAIAADVTIAPVAPSVCVGDQITITATGTGTGNFPVYDFYLNNNLVQSGSSTTYTYTPADQDQVFVIMTSSYSCATNNPAVSNFETITVNTIPAQPTITPDGPTTFCQGGSVTLTSSAVGGNLWSPGGETTDAIVVTTSGSYTVTQTVNGCTSPASDPVVVTVNTATATIVPSGSITACSNDEVTFTASAVPPAVSYLWSPGGQTTDTIKTAIAGTYSVTTTDANGCTATASVTVTTNTAPSVSISGASIICTGLTETLTANATPGTGNIVSYQWMLNGDTIVGATASTHVATINGNYTVIVNDDLGCSAESAVHVLGLNGPMVGTYTVSSAPASCTNYNTIALAVYDLSNRGVAGNVIIDVEPGHTETAPAGGILLTNCTLAPGLESNASQTITIKKSAAGTNPLITAGTGTGTGDVIFALGGVDYVTIDGIDLAANVANVTPDEETEWGYLLTACSGTNGAQYNTIQNSVVTLDKSNTNTNAGIAILNNAGLGTVVVTAASGTNSYNKFYSNTVTNALNGIRLFGYNDVAEPYSFYDQGNEIGAVGMGNIITNFGRGATVATAHGIYAERNNNIKIKGNTVNSTGGDTHIGELHGIGTAYARWANVEITHNTVTVVSQVAAAATHSMRGIYCNSGNREWWNNASAPANTILIDNNIVQNCNYMSGAGDFRGISYNKYDTLAAHTITISNNQVLNNTSASTNTGVFPFGGIISQPAANVYNVTGNTISGNSYTGTAAAAFRMLVLSWGWTIPTDSWVEVKNITGNRVTNNTTASPGGSYQGIVLETITSGTQLPGSAANISNNYVGDVTLAAGTTGSFAGITTSSSDSIAVTMSYDTVANITRTTATTGAFEGIRSTSTLVTNVTMTNNRVTGISMPAATSATFNGITNSGSSTATDFVNLSGNTVSGISYSGTGLFNGISANTTNGVATIENNTVSNVTRTGTSGTFDGITFTGSSTGTDSVSFKNNTVSGNTMSGTGTLTFLDAGSAVKIGMYNNTVTNNTRDGASGTMYCSRAATAEVTYSGNTITNNSHINTSGSTSASIYGFYDASSPTIENFTNNTINNLSITGTNTSTSGILYGIHSNSVSGSVKNISGNIIHSLSASTPATVAGINSTAGSPEIHHNKIYNLSTTSASSSALVTGVQVTTGVNTTVHNNIIGDLKATLNAGSDAIRGINITQTSTSSNVNLYYNTIYIDGTSSAATFGTTGIYTSTSTTATSATLDMRNNLVYNISVPKGTGRAVAYRRSSTTLTNMGPNVNNNLYYVAVGANNHVFSNGTNHLDLAGYKALSGIAPRESNSVTENVSFQSTVSSDANYMKVSTASPTLVEGGGQAISGITTDYFGTTRAGVGPDIGAHEDNFQNIALNFSSISASPSTTQCVATARTITAVMDEGAAPVVSVTLFYAFNGGSAVSVPMSNGGSGLTYTGTIPAATPGNAVVTWYITASDGTYTPTTAVQSYQDELLTGVTVVAEANPTTVCSGSPSVLTATVINPGVAQIGTGTSTSSTYPYYRLYGSSKTQMLYRADELTAAGLSAGPITAVGFDISSASTAMPNFKVFMKQTASTTLTDFESGMTEVYSDALYTPVVGVSAHPVTGFTWDGTSNIIVEICFENNDAGGSSTTIRYSNPGYASVYKEYQDNAPNHCTTQSIDALTSSSSTIRPNLYIAGNTASGTFTYSWSDGTNTVGTTNPVTVNPLATTNYTVTATNGDGCSITSAPVTVSIIPLATDSIEVSAAVCESGFSLTAHTIGGGEPYSYAWSDGSATVYPNSQTINPVLPPGTYNFSVTVTDGCGGNVVMNRSVTVNGLPTITVSSDPANMKVCGQAATLTASGGISYTWAPADGLSSTTGSSVQALPTDTTTYTVSGTDANGCVNTASITLTVESPILMAATGTPSTLCAGGDVQLNANVTVGFDSKFTFASGTGVALADTTGASIVVAGDVDDAPMVLVEGGTTNTGSIPIGFSFTYDGTTYDHFSASPDGWITLKTSTANATSDFSNDLEFPSNDPTIAPFWDDLNTGDVTAGLGHVKAKVSGVAPNRVLLLHWYVTTPRDLAGAANSQFQALLYEGTNVIEFRYGTINGTAQTASIGLTSVSEQDAYYSVDPVSNSVSTTVDTEVAAGPTPGTSYTFTPFVPTYNYSWSPTTDLNDATIANPLATNLQDSVDYIVTVTNPVTGCYVKDTVVVTVNPLPAATFTGLAATYCSSDAASTLTGTPANGTFSGPGISGNVFTPSVAGPGVHTITYSVTDISTGCSNSTSQQVTVNEPTVFFTGLNTAYCINAAAVTLTGNQAPAGTFSGPGVTDNADGTATFNPATAGAGTHNITYSYTDGNGCSASDVQSVTVNALPAVSFSGLAATYCDNSAAVTLTSNQSGGTFTGAGITDNGNGTASFNPATAGTGTHTITFTYTDGNGCSNSTSQQTTVGAGATVSFSGLAASYCYDVENVVTLTGSPAGGTFSGNGISGNTFTPSVVGTYDITYTYDNGSCITTATQSVTVNALPTVSFSGLAGPYCADAAAVTLTGSPAGGTFSGPGISGNTFDPAVAGAGTWTIIYNYTDGNGCSNSAEQQVTVNALPVVSFSGLAATYCTTDAAATLTGSPVGGTFSGPGMTGNSFDPAAAGVGTHTITYTYTDGNGCTATSTQQVEVEVCTPTFVTVNVKAFLEGFYTGGSTMMSTLYDLGMDTDPTATDSIDVNLWSPSNLSSPTPDYSLRVLLHNNGAASAQFPSTVNGGSYYIAIKHRNSLETWSKNPLTLSGTNTYDFSTSAAQAYDDGVNVPMKDMGGVFAFYSGDNNQDGTVDVVDMIAVDNDASIFAFGYNVTDCTGDGSSDLLDIIVVDNNSALFLFYARPY